MSQSERSNPNVDQALEKLQDALSLIMILENDLSALNSDQIYYRTVKVIHEIINTAKNELLN